MKTKDILKQAIKDFNGTVIVVSHDREFLDGLVEKVYEFGGGKVTECLGGIYEFLEKKRIASLNELELSSRAEQLPTAKTAEPTAKTAAPDNTPTKRLSYAEQRERDKTLKRAQKAVDDAESEISRLEGVIADIEKEIADGNSSTEIFNRHAAANKDLENAMSIWELACQSLEELRARYSE
jgi:ATP-binding cassette subfamily F protein 3